MHEHEIKQKLRNIDETSPTVQTHLGILQGVIDRMATNSASCKAWCIAAVSAILVVVADKNKPNYALLSLVPTFLFLVLDIYYLAYERGFRNSYDNFVRKVHSGTLLADDLFSVRPTGGMCSLQCQAMRSFSIWAFYGIITILIVLAWQVILVPPATGAAGQ
jgi:hypothetical protein